MPTEPPAEGTPRLVVLVIADQFRFDYLERGRPMFTGGLARLLAEGVSFTEAHHGHALTLTGPGYAALATGAHPGRSGIVGNDWIQRPQGVEVNCVEDEKFGTSPEQMEVSGLGDWMKERYPDSKVYSVSGKDRGAVLPGGRNADGAFWFDGEEGGLTTSGYYERRVPEWLQEVNRAGPPGDLFLGGWEPLPVDASAAATAGFLPFDRGPFDSGFPRLVGGGTLVPEESFLWDFYRTPFLDTWVAQVGMGLVERHELGADEWPDLLALGFSALDTVGHQYGPNSLEILDTLLRLDRSLGEVFDHLDATVGRDRYVVAFSSDHGVVPLPEVRQRPDQRAGLEEVTCRRRVVSDFKELYGDDVWLAEPFYLDHVVLEAAGSSARAAQVELAERLGACPQVERVWTLEELTAEGPDADLSTLAPGSDGWYQALYRNSIFEDRSPDVLIQWQDGFLTSIGHWTTHGSPYDYDTHVPFLLLGEGLGAGEVDDVVLTVDLAPTLAVAVGVAPPEEIDGRSRAEAARRAVLGADPPAASIP